MCRPLRDPGRRSEHYACRRPLQRVAAWLGDQGLPVAPRTLTDSVPRFVPLFEPLAEAIRAHQNASALRHADETTWRVQALRAEGRSARAWLWTSVGNDAVCFHINPSRSAEAAQRLFGELRTGTVIVCDRYSAYKKLARLLGGMVTLQFCWSHQRRDFIQCAAGQVDLAGWCEAWLERVAALYRLNEARLVCHEPDTEYQTTAFDAAQRALAAALGGLFAEAERELVELLQRQGYRQAPDLRRFQLARTVPARDDGPPIDVVVDFLMPRDAVIAKSNPPLVSNFAVQRADGAELALNFYQMVAIDGGMPDGGRNLVSIAVASIPALLAMKGYAIAKRQKPKDAYDIYYCVLNYPRGVDGLVSATLPLLEVDIARTGYRNIAGKFRTVDDYGPICVRRFVDGSPLLGQRTPHQWQQDAFGQVDAWLVRLGLR